MQSKQPYDLKKTVKMDERDHKIFLAMLNNLESFLRDATTKCGSLPNCEFEVMFHVEQKPAQYTITEKDFDHAFGSAFAVWSPEAFQECVQKFKRELFTKDRQA